MPALLCTASDRGARQAARDERGAEVGAAAAGRGGLAAGQPSRGRHRQPLGAAARPHALRRQVSSHVTAAGGTACCGSGATWWYGESRDDVMGRASLW